MSGLCPVEMERYSDNDGETSEKWNTIPTTYYVNIPQNNCPPELRQRIRSAKESIESFARWATGFANDAVQKKIDAGEFRQYSSGAAHASAVLRYRCKVLEAVLNTRATCLTSTQEYTSSIKPTTNMTDIESKALSLVSKGFPVTESLKGAIGVVVEKAVESVQQMGGETISQSLLATVIVYDRTAGTIDPKLRLVTFETTPREISVRKHLRKTAYWEVEIAFTGSEWKFAMNVWDKLYKQVEPELLERGRKLMSMPMDIAIDS